MAEYFGTSTISLQQQPPNSSFIWRGARRYSTPSRANLGQVQLKEKTMGPIPLISVRLQEARQSLEEAIDIISDIQEELEI